MWGHGQARAYTAPVDTGRLPGAELIEAGLRDLAAGRESTESLLVLIGAPRLRRIGIDIPLGNADWTQTPGFSPEHRLYTRLASADPDSAHSRYNALIRTLVSFERAAECVS